MMKPILGILCASVVIGSCSRAHDTHPDQTSVVNQLTSDERAAGWKLLFDGKTIDHWRGYRKAAPPRGWQVVDGAITRVDSAGDLISADEYRDFALSLEWKVAQGGNSGIFWRVSEDLEYPWESGPEMQVLDDARHPDGRSLLTSAGSLFGLYPSRRGVVHVAGEWNAVRIQVQGNHVEYWLNGVKLVDAKIGSEDWNARVARSKFATMPRYGKNQTGRIGLQDHGNWVAFRNIKIRVLKGPAS
jgi:3-keto-disaccharide hydrolase